MKIEFTSAWELIGVLGITATTIGGGIVFLSKKMFENYLQKVFISTKWNWKGSR